MSDSKIFLPLRSNADWFRTEDLKNILIRRIKIYMMIYDEIILQDGRYHCIIGDTGSFDSFIPAPACGFDRAVINYSRPGEPYSLRFINTKTGNDTILSGKTVVSYEADFYPILNEAGISQEGYFNWEVVDLTSDGKRYVAKQSQNIIKDGELNEHLPEGSYLKKKLIESFYFDTLMAFEMRNPLSMDHRFSPILDHVSDRQIQSLQPEIRAFFHNHWISLNFPDFSEYSWEELHEIRTSMAGQEFRSMVDRVIRNVTIELPKIEKYEDVIEIINKEFIGELVDEINKRRSNIRELGVNLALNVVPLGSIVSVANDIRNYIEDKNSWISLLN